ncbi:MAG: prepilin-type N-terminal cleavage/methylation domain-containing protein [Gemmatimonadaceae bacterium]
MPRRKSGFTLIELLMVMVIIGLLAAISIPKFSSTKGRAYATRIKSDLVNLAMQQELYFFNNGVYSPTASLAGMDPSDGVTLTIIESTGSGWSATSTHPSAAPLVCAVFYGSASPVAPALSSGVVHCQ